MEPLTAYIGEVESAGALAELARMENAPARDRVQRAFTDATPGTLPFGAPARLVTLSRGDLVWFLASLRARVDAQLVVQADQRAVGRLIAQLVYMSG